MAIPDDPNADLSASAADGDLDRMLPALAACGSVNAANPFWLHAFWELTSQSVHRAAAALGSDWHEVRPVIRLYDATSGNITSTRANPLRDIVVHGGASRWYIDVMRPPRAYQTAIGYLTRTGRFFPLAESNVVVLPDDGSDDPVLPPQDLPAANSPRPLPVTAPKRGLGQKV